MKKDGKGIDNKKSRRSGVSNIGKYLKREAVLLLGIV